jgi:hypothetical protein
MLVSWKNICLCYAVGDKEWLVWTTDVLAQSNGGNLAGWWGTRTVRFEHAAFLSSIDFKPTSVFHVNVFYMKYDVLLSEELDGSAVSAIAEAKQRSQWSFIGWVTKIHYLELLRASEGTLSHWSRLHLQSLSPIPVSRRVDVRQAAGRKNNCRIFITTWWRTCCTDST